MARRGSPVRNLAVVDLAFGRGADLYSTVLHVKPNASFHQIQSAFLQQRGVLLQKLEQQPHNSVAQRARLEAQVDATVLAMRILGEAQWRSEYDDVRSERLLLWTGQQSWHSNNNGNNNNSGTTTETSFSSTSRAGSADNGELADIPMMTKKTKTIAPTTTLRSKSMSLAATAAATPSPTRLEHRPRQHPPDWSSSRQPPGMDTSRQQQPPLRTPTAPASSSTKRKKRLAVVTPDEKSSNTLHARNRKQQLLLNRTAETWDDNTSTTRDAHLTRNGTITLDDDDADDDEDDDDEEEEEDVIASDEETQMTVSGRAMSVIERIQDEIIGALEDTTSSLEQVFTVFTLQEEDISAVTGKIAKAKRQIKRAL
jgi:hypothetical protein